MARTSIGLDIGTRAVRLAEVEYGSGHATLTRFGRMLLPLGAVDHGEIHDPHAVATAITTLWKRLGLSGKAVHVGMSNRRVVVRVIEMPAMSREDLAGAIRFQAQEHIPIPLDQAVMDFEVLEELSAPAPVAPADADDPQIEAGPETPETEAPAAATLMRVLVVAAERATIEPMLAAIREAKLDLASLELNAYPLVRCFGGSEEPEAIVDIGAGVTNVVVHRGGKIRFTRILPTFGGDEFTQAVASGLGIDRDAAEAMKRRASAMLAGRARQPVAVSAGSSFEPPFGGDAPASGEVMQGPADPHGGSELDRAAAILEPILDRFTNEIRGSLDFHAGQSGARPVVRVVLTGGGSLLGGVRERLASSLGIPVELGHPFERVPIGRVQVSAEERAIAEPFLGVVTGLALAGAK